MGMGLLRLPFLLAASSAILCMLLVAPPNFHSHLYAAKAGVVVGRTERARDVAVDVAQQHFKQEQTTHHAAQDVIRSEPNTQAGPTNGAESVVNREAALVKPQPDSVHEERASTGADDAISDAPADNFSPNGEQDTHSGNDGKYQHILDEWQQCQVLLFLHVAKTGGTTVQAHVSSHHRATRLSGNFNSEANSRTTMREAKSAVSGGRKFVAVVEEPLPYLLRHGLGALANTTCVTISSIRDPYSWAVSAYNHARNGKKFLTHEYFTTTQNPQLWFLKGAEDVRFRSVTLVDFARLNELLEVVSKHFGGEYTEREASNSASGLPWYDRNTSLVQWTEQQNFLDLELYNEIIKPGPALIQFTSLDELPPKLLELLGRFEFKRPTMSMEDYLKSIGKEDSIEWWVKNRRDETKEERRIRILRDEG